MHRRFRNELDDARGVFLEHLAPQREHRDSSRSTQHTRSCQSIYSGTAVCDWSERVGLESDSCGEFATVRSFLDKDVDAKSGKIVGRKLAYNACVGVLFGLTIGAAVAPNMPAFVAMRVLSGLQGCYFHVAGQTIIAEYFPPVRTTPSHFDPMNEGR